MSFNWTCPHCATPQAVSDEKHDFNMRSIGLKGQTEGNLVVQDYSIGCVNPSCSKMTIRIKIAEGEYNGHRYVFKKSGAVIFDQHVYPQALTKPQPDYIPHPIREDYYEACLIRDLSPKASATLIRRCLQGMIRDFAGISKSRLIDEIKELRATIDNGSADRAISLESVDAIDRVRSVGNIGAHMEKDIDLIVPVEPGEAQALIELVEVLFDEWYGAREKRKARFARIDAIADDKQKLISAHRGQRLEKLEPPASVQDKLGAGHLNALLSYDPSSKLEEQK